MNQIIIAITPEDKELARDLINEVFRMFQPILRKDRDLIPIEKLNEELSGKNKELIILHDLQNKVRGAALLNFEQDDIAYISYLATHPTSPRGQGKDLLMYAENRAEKTYHKKKIRLSTVYHPKYPQEKLIVWYLNQNYRFLKIITPTKAQQQAWEPKFQEDTRFKYFEKDL